MSELIFEVPATFDGCTVNDFLRRGKGVSYHLIKTLKRLDGPWGLFCNERPVRTVDSVRTRRPDHSALAGKRDGDFSFGGEGSGIV